MSIVRLPTFADMVALKGVDLDEIVDEVDRARMQRLHLGIFASENGLWLGYTQDDIHPHDRFVLVRHGGTHWTSINYPYHLGPDQVNLHCQPVYGMTYTPKEFISTHWDNLTDQGWRGETGDNFSALFALFRSTLEFGVPTNLSPTLAHDLLLHHDAWLETNPEFKGLSMRHILGMQGLGAYVAAGGLEHAWWSGRFK